MGRPNSIWWWAARGRWTFTVNGKRHVAPKTIVQGDRKGAERWLAEQMATLYPDRQIAADMPPTTTSRIAKLVRLRPISIKRLRKLVLTRRAATGKPIHPGHILDELIAEAHRVGRLKPTRPEPD